MHAIREAVACRILRRIVGSENEVAAAPGLFREGAEPGAVLILGELEGRVPGRGRGTPETKNGNTRRQSGYLCVDIAALIREPLIHGRGIQVAGLRENTGTAGAQNPHD